MIFLRGSLDEGGRVKRRSFLAGLAALSPTLAFRKAFAQSQGRLPKVPDANALPIVQTIGTGRMAQFTIMVAKTRDLNYQVQEEGQKSVRVVERTNRYSRSDSEMALDKLTVDGLAPGRNYRLIVSEKSQEIDVRSFSTVDTERQNLKFVLASCSHDRFNDAQVSMWQAVMQENPDFIFFIGDSVYCDQGASGTGPAALWTRHAETRGILDIFRAKRLIPMLAVWDDHDFGMNNSDRGYPYKDESRQIFQAFFGANETEGFVKGLGVSSRFEICGHRFYLMDGRTYRSRLGDSDQQHWGAAQEEWLYKDLKSKNMPTYIFTGSQFFGGYLQKDSFEFNHPDRIKEVMSQLAKVPSPIILGSGDVHFSEIMELEAEILGYKSYELTSSGIHSWTTPFGHARTLNPRRLDSDTSEWKFNFMVISSRAATNRIELSVRCRGATNIYFERNLTVQR